MSGEFNPGVMGLHLRAAAGLDNPPPLTFDREGFSLPSPDAPPAESNRTRQFATVAGVPDPSAITTHEQALGIITTLEMDIANIQAQVDATQISANVRPLSADRLAWVQRASYAAAMKRQVLQRVISRDRELRGVLARGCEPGLADRRAQKAVKHQAMVEQAQARKAADLRHIEELKTEQQRLAQQKRELEQENLRLQIRDARTRAEHYERAVRRIAAEDAPEPYGSASEYARVVLSEIA